MKDQVLVIDVGGTFIKYGLIDEQCHLTQTSKIKTPYESQEHFLETLQNIYFSFSTRKYSRDCDECTRKNRC